MSFDPYDPDVLDDPYPYYAELRATSPVHYLEDYDLYLVTRYDDLISLKRDPTTFSSDYGMSVVYPGFLQGGRAKLRDAQGMSAQDIRSGIAGTPRANVRNVVHTDPPLHSHLRRMVTKPFLPRMIARLESHIRDLTEKLVDELLLSSEDGTVDLASRFTYPLPVIVIAEMLGISSDRWEDFKRWSHDGLSVGIGDGGGEAVSQEQRAASAQEAHAFWASTIEERRRNPGDDLVSGLLETAGRGDDPLNTEELISFVNLLLVAGNETTTNLMSNLFFALCNHPDQLRRLRDDPTLIRAAVEEGMRYDAPVQALFRSTTRPVAISGYDLPANAGVMTVYGAANRDELHYDLPDQFLVDRNPTDHTGFGWGIHLCLGASLARLETRLAVEIILSRTTDIVLAGKPTRPGNPVLRGMNYLPVHLQPV